MNTITILKKEYKALIDVKLRYDYLSQIMRGNVFSPPIKNKAVIIKAFRATGKYNQKFLKSLEKGLKQSTYFK